MSCYKPAGYDRHIIKLKVGTREHKFPGVSDKSVSQAVERHIKQLISVRSGHESIPLRLAQWLQDLPRLMPAVFDKLVEYGLVPQASSAGSRPLLELLYGVIEESSQFRAKREKYRAGGNSEIDAHRKTMAYHSDLYSTTFIGWFQFLLANENTPDYVLLRTARARAIIEGCKLKTFEDLKPDRILVWLKSQRGTRTDFGAATSNHHLKAIKSFAEWARSALHRDHERNPLEKLRPINEQLDVRRKRRAPTSEELTKLFTAVAVVGNIFGLCATDREMLYRVALVLGLRASECASLTPQSFHFSADKNEVSVAAAYSKHRRQDTIPIPTDLVLRLQKWLEGRPQDGKLWPGRWFDEAAEMLRRDLKQAGIAYKNSDGYFDFHATRHGAITNGSHVMEIYDLKDFARHGKVETTMRYMHRVKKRSRTPLIGCRISPAKRHRIS